MEIIKMITKKKKKEKEFLWHRKKNIKKERNECSLGCIVANALPLA